MIGRVRLAETQIITSRLAFGTSRLHYVNQGERQRLLAAAADLGIVHFDASPAYGDGLAETELGRFLSNDRHRFVVVTKYGIPADWIMEKLKALAPTLRILRAVSRRFGLWNYPLPPITAAGLRLSLESSLRRLKTDWIDIILLHEPSLRRLTQPDEILEELRTLRERGLIRAFGLAGAWDAVSTVISSKPDLAQIVQTAETEWQDVWQPQITYGAISRAAQSYLGSNIETDIACARVRSALVRRPNGVIIVSTSKLDHLRDLARAAAAT